MNDSTISNLFGTSAIASKDGDEISLQSLSGKIVGIYFSAHWCPPCRGFTPVLAQRYNDLKSAGKDFEVIFVSSDRDQSAFDEYYLSMPWLALQFAERERKQELSSKFGVRGIPTLVLVDGTSGEVITKNGRSAIMECEFNALRTYDADQAAAAAQLEEKMAAAPEEITHESHAHPLKKTTNEKLGGPYQGGFGCNICQGGGRGWVYHCDECCYDAHPKCVGAA
jgi:nucleoredoxin